MAKSGIEIISGIKNNKMKIMNKQQSGWRK